MAKTKRSPLEHRTNREKLPRGERAWVATGDGLALGYRRTAKGFGMWQARRWTPTGYTFATLGEADDLRESDGGGVLTYFQAVERARNWAADAAKPPPRPRYDVLAAFEDYARTKTANLPDPRSATVWRDLRTMAKHLSGEFLARDIDTLTTAEVERWRDALAVKPATKRRIYTVLAAALSNAHRLHRVGNPDTWRLVEPVKIPKARRARLFIPTEKEIAALLKACEPDFAALVRAAVITGMRYGELAALEVEDFDARKGVLALRVSKTGEREVVLSSAAVTFFAAQTKGKLLRARIFATAEGEHWGPSMQHRRMRAATSLRAFVFYSLRHYALSRQLAAGIPSALVAKNAGTSEAMLRAHYHKFIAEEDRTLFDRVPAIA